MVDGVLVVDKPAGVGSTDVVRVVRRASRQKRVGHTGTLDPGATGVLVVCLGRATRLVRFLQAGRKTYRAAAVLGVETTTQDASGEVVAERPADGVTEAAVAAALERWTGEVEQVPPMVSALKVGGERLYEKARRGEEVERPPRRVTIHELRMLDFEPGTQARFSFLVTCSSGTYVRTLAHDVGRALGVGASLTDLRRLANGPFAVDEAHPLDEVAARGEDGSLVDIVLTMADAVRGLPAVEVDRDAALDAATGRPLPAAGVDGPFALLHAGELVGVFADRGGAARPEAVFAQPADLAR